jgi:hypothetical protein
VQFHGNFVILFIHFSPNCTNQTYFLSINSWESRPLSPPSVLSRAIIAVAVVEFCEMYKPQRPTESRSLTCCGYINPIMLSDNCMYHLL